MPKVRGSRALMRCSAACGPWFMIITRGSAGLRPAARNKKAPPKWGLAFSDWRTKKLGVILRPAVLRVKSCGPAGRANSKQRAEVRGPRPPVRWLVVLVGYIGYRAVPACAASVGVALFFSGFNRAFVTNGRSILVNRGSVGPGIGGRVVNHWC